MERENHGLTTEDIRNAVVAQLESLISQWDPTLPSELKPRAAAILKQWQWRGKLRRAAEALVQYEKRTLSAEAEAAKWREHVQALLSKPGPPPAASTPAEARRQPFKSAKDVLELVEAEWSSFLVIHPKAFTTARDVSPPYTLKGLKSLYTLLCDLGEFSRQRQLAEAGELDAPDINEHFGGDYARTESGETKKRYRKVPFEHDGATYRGLQHLKKCDEGGHQIRVYFDELPDFKLLVCAIGHLPTFGHDG